MAADDRSHVTGLVAGLDAERLLPLVYEELRRIASRLLHGERRDHTLQATALVHEAYLKLVDQSRVDWRGRTHFLAIGAQAMRRILIDHARGLGRAKRGGDRRRVTLTEPPMPRGSNDLGPEELLALDAALHRLKALDQRQAQVVELRFFAGMSMDEVASALGVSKRTAEADWTHARAWLRRELARGES